MTTTAIREAEDAFFMLMEERRPEFADGVADGVTDALETLLFCFAPDASPEEGQQRHAAFLESLDDQSDGYRDGVEAAAEKVLDFIAALRAAGTGSAA